MQQGLARIRSTVSLTTEDSDGSSLSAPSSGGAISPPADFFDKTFRKGSIVRCTAVVMIAINYLLFIIGFVTAVYGLRVGSQEVAQMEFLQVRLFSPSSATTCTSAC